MALITRESLVHEESLSWQGVCYHFNTWGKQGTWRNLWLTRLRFRRRTLSLTKTQLDGRHTLAKNGGAAISYQGRKAGRTTNALFLVNNQRLPLAVATPQAGNQHETFELERVFAELFNRLKAAEFRLKGLFLNIDKAFYVSNLRETCTQRGVEANVPHNRRSADWLTDNNRPLEPELYHQRLVFDYLPALRKPRIGARQIIRMEEKGLAGIANTQQSSVRPR